MTDGTGERGAESAPDRIAATQSFYGRWARLYDRFARLPWFESWRERAAEALALSRGDTVVEMGCGTGANLPHLRERVGASGTVIGLDLTRGMLATARRDIRERRWENVHVVQADATDLPIDGEVDAVLATFVVGMLADPASEVRRWVERVRSGGRVALLDAAPTDRPLARPLNVPFAAFVWASAPGKRLAVGRPSRQLGQRVDDAREALLEATTAGRTERFGAGFVRLTYGTRPAE
jgi:ubiquinone/menaquinone biosynthesis C-methylase UbiE